MKKSLWSLIFHCQSTWDTHFFQSFSNACYHYCWLISWCRGKNSFMGTWRGHNWIIFAVINGSATPSLHCYETCFHNFSIKTSAPGCRKMPRVVKRHGALPLRQKEHLSTSCSEHCSPAYCWSSAPQQSHSAFPSEKKNVPNLPYKCLWGEVNQEWYLKTLLENIKALLFSSLPPQLARWFCLYRNK